MPVDTLDMHRHQTPTDQKLNGRKIIEANREAAKAFITGTDPTRHYRPPVSRWYETIHEDLPPFTLRHARLMMFDPVVRFGLNVRDAALSLAQVDVKSDSQAVTKFVGNTWQSIWGGFMQHLLKTKRYGYSGFQVNYAENPKTRFVQFQSIKPFAPTDVRPLVSGSNVVGLTIRKRHETDAERLFAPRSLWTTFDAEWNYAFGWSILRRSYSPWWEKWMDNGVKKVTQLRMIKDAYLGLRGYFPDGNPNFRDPEGNQIPYSELVRESCELLLAGGIAVLPARFDANGNRTVSIEAAEDTGNPDGIWQWSDRTDKQISAGLDVFEEVIQASQTGSGYSGRSIPLMMFLQAVSMEFSELLTAIDRDIIRWLVWINFGSMVDYTIRPASFIEAFAEDTKATQMGGPVGASAGEQQPTSQPGQPAPQPQGQRAPTGGSQFSETGPQRAPKGGVTIQGTFYRGGEWIPGEVLESATEEERKAIDSSAGQESAVAVGKSKPTFDQYMSAKNKTDAEVFREAKADGISIPPAWTQVTYYGATQDIIAEGRDLVGRKQRMENPEYRKRISAENNARITRDLKPRMQQLRERLREDAIAGDEQSKVLYLISLTGFRIGGRGDGRSKVQAFGASTLRGEHVSVEGDTVTFDFPGKKGVRQQHTVTDPVIAGMMQEAKSGHAIFTTRDSKIRDAWKSKYGGEKVHDLRHVVATEIAEKELINSVPPRPKTEREKKRLIKSIAKTAAKKLGNNPSQTLGTYIDPRLWDRLKVAV